MSVVAQAHVWKRYPGSGAELLLAVALADCADDAGGCIYPSVETMALKTRQSERTVQRQIQAMCKMGWLHLVRSSTGRRGMTHEYRICPVWMAGGELVAPEVVPDRRAKSVKQKRDAAEQSSTGDKLTPVNVENDAEKSVDKLSTTGDTGGLSGDTGGLSGDIAVSPNPSITINNIKTPLPPVDTGGGFENPKQPVADDQLGLSVKRETAVTKKTGQGERTPSTIPKPEWRWHKTRAGIESMGEKLGLGRWDEQAFNLGRGELFSVYERRVSRAYESVREAAAAAAASAVAGGEKAGVSHGAN
jgi:Helix-turn-helix domain